MLLCGFLGRHKLVWSGLKELKLLLALGTAGRVVGPAGVLDNVCAFLSWALRSSHLPKRQGDIPNALFVFTNGAQAPKAPSSHQISTPGGRFSSGLCWMLPSLSSWVFAPQRGLCRVFSPSWHIWALEEPLRAGGRWSWDVQGQAWLAVRSHPVQAVQTRGWGTPGAALARVCPLMCHPPGTAWPQPCREWAPLPGLLSLSSGHSQGCHRGHQWKLFCTASSLLSPSLGKKWVGLVKPSPQRSDLSGREWRFWLKRKDLVPSAQPRATAGW